MELTERKRYRIGKLTFTWEDVLILVISICLLALSVLKAYSSSLVYDEMVTYFDFAIKPYHEITGYGYLTANNHMLNSFLIKTLFYILPDNQLVLRLPNILSHALYLFFSWKIVSTFTNSWLRLSSFLLLNLNLYLLDFFCLARGYGLSIGLMMTAFYFYFQFLRYRGKELDAINRKRQLWYLTLGLSSFGAATLASFTLLNVFIIFVGLHLLIITYDIHSTRYNKRDLRFSLTKAAILLVIAFLILNYCIPICLRLSNKGELYFGGKVGFWENTVDSITTAFFYGHDGAWRLKKIVLAFMVLMAIWAVVTLIRYRKIDNNRIFQLSLFLLLLGAVVASIVQHYVFGSPYSMDRTALFYIPLFLINIVLLINSISYRFKIVTIVIVASAFFLVLSLVKDYTPVRYREWLDASRFALEYLDTINKNKPDKSIVVYVDWIQEKVSNYYVQHNHYKWVRSISQDGEKEGYRNGYFIGGEEEVKTHHFPPDFKELKEFPDYKLYVYGPK